MSDSKLPPENRLVPDIRPEIKTDRSKMGMVEICLDGGTRVKCIGLVYGIEHKISGENYEVELFLDHYSQRIKVSHYRFDAGYLRYMETVFQKDYLYAVAEHKGSIVSAASAELFHSKRSAELTDCATHPDFRGKGLMAGILALLEDKLRRENYLCAYTMARARSFGMNRVFYQMDFTFSGRLVNNCDIYGSYEDMNIWVKKL